MRFTVYCERLGRKCSVELRGRIEKKKEHSLFSTKPAEVEKLKIVPDLRIGPQTGYVIPLIFTTPGSMESGENAEKCGSPSPGKSMCFPS